MPLSPSPGGGSSSNSRAASAARKVYSRIKYGEEDPSRFVVRLTAAFAHHLAVPTLTVKRAFAFPFAQVLLQDEEVLFTALLEMEEAGSAVPFHFIRSIRDCTDGSEIFALQSQSPSNPATPPLAARPPRPPPVDQDAPPAAVELPDVLWCVRFGRLCSCAVRFDLSRLTHCVSLQAYRDAPPEHARPVLSGTGVKSAAPRRVSFCGVAFSARSAPRRFARA